MHINVNNQDELIKGTYNNVNGYGVKSYGLSSNGVKETKVNAPLEVSFTGMMKDSINTSEIYGANKEQIDNELMRNENLAAQMAEAVNNLKEMITPEGYNALSELGIIPDEEDPQMVIGVCERIQMQLAAYCEDYKPVGLNIDKAKMAEVLGSEVFAKSVEKAMDLAYISDESKAAVIKGSKNLSIDEVYKCAHSVIGTGSTKTSNIASTMDKQNVAELAKDIIDNLKPQIERIFSKIGLEATEENMDTAMWMLRNDVPLTEENIIKAIKINEMLSLPKDVFEQVVKENISLSMYFAADVKDAYFVKNQYDVSKVAEAIDALENATEETVENILAEGKILNIANIKATLAYASTTIKTESADSQKSTASNESVVAKQARMFANAVTSKSILVTAKAVLTSTALLKMQQVGIDIDMTSLTEMIEIESATYNKMAESYSTTAEVTIEESKVSVFAETLQAREYIRSASVSIVAKVSVSDTLQSVSITAKATQAVAAYDAIGTSVRRDMGDTYTKAFSNIDELLDAIEVDKNTSTRRAARILGYNSMDITSENILKIEAVANEIDYLVDNLTPRTVSYLLANDINPLDKDIKSLNEQLAKINEELGIVENEDYAMYLWKLDNAGGISKEDREKYISIYRTIKAITKKDGRAIGAAVLCDYELTMENILTAEKNRKYSGEMDTAKKDMDYMKYKTELLKDMGTVTESEVKELINHNVDVNFSNLKKLKELKDGNKGFINLYETGKDSIKSVIDSINEDFDKSFESEETLKNTIEDLKAAAANELEESRESLQPTYNGINEALHNFGLVNIISAYAGRSSYYVPVEIGGEITNINLTIEQSEETSKVSTYIKESVYGRMSLEISVTQTKISGLLVYEDSNKLSAITEIFNEYMAMLQEEMGENISIDIKLINSRESKSFEHTKENMMADNEDSDKAKIDSTVLFNSAKLFISTLRTYEI